ncbi:hypothetical protein SO486_08700 [Pseudomonas salmasensis]|uniref:Uncharacterized protein n=1 Tax=Pseudomonas salmasensis TaxID=2745514 RepID=A0ABU5FD96_9PSED|nr:hypothetical protein [Pseudomonas salmasensis]MDY4300065.1 hypothetical protein [Pseudomonas salmasensis]
MIGNNVFNVSGLEALNPPSIFGLPAPDNAVPASAMTLRSFAVQPSFAGNQVPNDSQVIEGEVVERLLQNFSVFEDPSSPGRITVGSLVEVLCGFKPEVSERNVELVKMIFLMPGLLNKLSGAGDVGKVGGPSSDGNIDKSDVEKLDKLHAPLRNHRREINKMTKY